MRAATLVPWAEQCRLAYNAAVRRGVAEARLREEAWRALPGEAANLLALIEAGAQLEPRTPAVQAVRRCLEALQ